MIKYLFKRGNPIVAWNNQPVTLILIKAALSFALVFVVAFLFKNQTTAFQAGTAAIMSLKDDRPQTIGDAVNRLFGTIVAGAMAMLFLLIAVDALQLAPGAAPYYVLEVSALLIMIAVFLILRRPGAVITAVIVFLLATLLSSAVEAPFAYVGQRVVDTAIGMVIALFVNWLPPLNRAFSYRFWDVEPYRPVKTIKFEERAKWIGQLLDEIRAEEVDKLAARLDPEATLHWLWPAENIYTGARDVATVLIERIAPLKVSAYQMATAVDKMTMSIRLHLATDDGGRHTLVLRSRGQEIYAATFI